MPIEKITSPDLDFEKKKQKYFSSLALSVRQALKLHKTEGLWEKNQAGEKDWRNVSEHCLVAAARAQVLSDLIGLSEPVKKELITAAALHDFFKRRQIEILRRDGLKSSSLNQTSKMADASLKEAGLPESLIRLVDSAGAEPQVLAETQRILKKNQLTEEDIAFLIMHYVDVYTIDSNWVVNAKEVNGKMVNELDRRVDKDEANENYRLANEQFRQDKTIIYNGMAETKYQAHRRLGHKTESLVADLICKKTGAKFEPAELPEIIDQEIMKRINRL